MAVVALMARDVFPAFDYVFAFFFEIKPAARVLADNVQFASWSGHSVSQMVKIQRIYKLFYFRTIPEIHSFSVGAIRGRNQQ
jgi:hypothetical protein